MQIERIDTDEILGLTCPATGHRLLWNDEDSGDILPEAVVSAVVSSLCSEECAVEALQLAAAWKQHSACPNPRKMS